MSRQTVVQVDVDVPCIECGYNLRTAPIDGTCPECGCSVGPSLEFRAWHNPATPEQNRRNRRQLVWYMLFLLLAVVAVVFVRYLVG